MVVDGAQRRLPIHLNMLGLYDVVYLGELIPNNLNSEIPRILSDEYVFLFTTLLNQDEQSNSYGHVEIDLIKIEDLPYFKRNMWEKASYHILGRENFKINDFLEIVQEETDRGKLFVAHLKDQKIVENELTVKYTRNFKILLFQQNNRNGFDNLPTFELGPEFQAQLDWDNTEDRLNQLRNAKAVLSQLIEENSGEVESIIKVNEILDAEISQTEKEAKRMFQHFLELRNTLLYVQKKVNDNHVSVIK